MDIAEALSKLRPGAVFNVRGNSYEGIEWLDESAKPSKDEVEAAIKANAYIEKRRREYPSQADQLDAMWKGGQDAEEMRQKILMIKHKYPKP